MKRRELLKFAFIGSGIIALSPILKSTGAIAMENITKINKTNEEWKKLLSPEQYNILREEGTERPFSSNLLHEHREGVFACAACDLELFPAKYKYDSGTGWPSFFDAIPNHLATKSDYKLFSERTEYHCARCGGHHGHVFDDGPKPTGLRYCNNGAALKFIVKPVT